MKFSNYPRLRKTISAVLPVVAILFFAACSEDESATEVYTKINEFYPPSAEVGAIVTINGENFSSSETGNSVKFGEAEADVKSASTNQLKVEVPKGATSAKISVTVKGTTVKSINTFNLIYNGPSISLFHPEKGPIGSGVTIEGTNFSEEPSENTVMFGEVQAKVLKSNEKELKVIVPENAITSKLSVTVDGETWASEDDFEVIEISQLNEIQTVYLYNLADNESSSFYNSTLQTTYVNNLFEGPSAEEQQQVDISFGVLDNDNAQAGNVYPNFISPKLRVALGFDNDLGINATETTFKEEDPDLDLELVTPDDLEFNVDHSGGTGLTKISIAGDKVYSFINAAGVKGYIEVVEVNGADDYKYVELKILVQKK
ncbi:IPT/TIG domain-containing protein [Muricauda sp. 2012CJ35-5]|uniref:IPT/TIG domain-containing protein n=1 Tax=Flagellimonas spongiicola TaxID=2942208 RepID=A0ABT0PQ09_9FLAO|nr:IPT/TIG domain-containing protein [Allomuricauda spongiicola]MCL6273477.1 IPT/TIG domain-containing protein [Allomuricauda spongiicola]